MGLQQFKVICVALSCGIIASTVIVVGNKKLTWL